MSLYISSLNSGSNGNCYYIGNEEEAILVDAGISCKETEKRLQRLGLSMDKVKAIFVSHEHSDHIAGIAILARKYQLPVYVTEGTRLKGRLNIEQKAAVSFRPFEPVMIGNISVTAFPKFHDACDPHSFVVASSSVTVGIFTDIGVPCKHLVNYFKLCHAAFLESNYDEGMLMGGRYPYYLKKRIMGGNGHLSNSQALQLFLTHRPNFMSHLLLSHLSKNNNCPKLVEELFSQHAMNTRIVIASRDQETPVFKITNEWQADQMPVPQFKNLAPMQLSLF